MRRLLAATSLPSRVRCWISSEQTSTRIKETVVSSSAGPLHMTIRPHGANLSIKSRTVFFRPSKPQSLHAKKTCAARKVSARCQAGISAHFLYSRYVGLNVAYYPISRCLRRKALHSLLKAFICLKMPFCNMTSWKYLFSKF